MRSKYRSSGSEERKGTSVGGSSTADPSLTAGK